MEAVLNYLDKVDAEGAWRARAHYACFDHFGTDLQAYGYATSFGLSESCEGEASKTLMELRQRAAEYARRDGRVAADKFFYAEQNARLVRNAEAYYRAMFRGRVASWNLRDRHMAETLDALVTYLDAQGQRTKAVIWAHNSPLGDARATESSGIGKLNVGQLVRERYGSEAILIGFTNYTGTVTAASNWDALAERKQVRPALPESFEAIFHETDWPRFLLNLRAEQRAAVVLHAPRLERAIGVIYWLETERASHFSNQFDAVLHFDQTGAVEPLERTSEWEAGAVPETFPTAL